MIFLDNYIKALDMAYKNRTPDPGVILHSDRGIQYASNIFRHKLKQYKMTQSMSRQGNCLENAPAESFFHTLTVEKVYGQTYETRLEAKSSIFEYIENFYNQKRRHSFLGLVSPMDFEYRYNQKTYKNTA